MQEVDFQKESEKIVQQINEWVKEKTNGMITRLLNSLEPETVVVLLNAIYFKGSWLYQFKKNSTQCQNFYNRGKKDEIQQVEMMQLKAPFLVMENDTFQALKLPYKGKDIAMLIFLPRSLDGLEELESKLNANFIRDVTKRMRERKVKVALPKFRLEYSKSLITAFKNLGMNRIFQRGAELGGMSDSNQLEVSDICHKAVLVVNEEGCEAAAATAVIIMKRRLAIEPLFIVDHPFLFIIYDERNGLILFIGRVQEL
ncbi:putative serpin-like protein, partial [Stegodyphus mimosarum]